MLNTGALHSNFIFIFEWILSAVLYTVLAGLMGAKEDYSKEEKEELEFQKKLKELVDREALEAKEKADTGAKVQTGGIVKALQLILITKMNLQF